MNRFIVPRPAAMPVNEPAQRIEEFLAAAGVICASSALDGDEVICECLTDPTSALRAYVSRPARREVAAAHITAILSRPPAQWTDAERAIVGLAGLLRLEMENE